MSVCARCNSPIGATGCACLSFDVDAFGNVEQVRTRRLPDPKATLDALEFHRQARMQRTVEEMRGNPESPLALY